MSKAENRNYKMVNGVNVSTLSPHNPEMKALYRELDLSVEKAGSEEFNIHTGSGLVALPFDLTKGEFLLISAKYGEIEPDAIEKLADQYRKYIADPSKVIGASSGNYKLSKAAYCDSKARLFDLGRALMEKGWIKARAYVSGSELTKVKIVNGYNNRDGGKYDGPLPDKNEQVLFTTWSEDGFILNFPVFDGQKNFLSDCIFISEDKSKFYLIGYGTSKNASADRSAVHGQLTDITQMVKMFNIADSILFHIDDQTSGITVTD